MRSDSHWMRTQSLISIRPNSAQPLLEHDQTKQKLGIVLPPYSVVFEEFSHRFRFKQLKISMFVPTFDISELLGGRLPNLRDWRRGEGFEPPIRPFGRIATFAGRCFRPLSHLSRTGCSNMISRWCPAWPTKDFVSSCKDLVHLKQSLITPLMNLPVTRVFDPSELHATSVQT